MTTDNSEGNSRLPLSNIVVVELGHSVAAPFGGQILADLGATVVKIEKSAGGDDARSWGPPFLGDTSTCYLSLNRNKYSVKVDLRDTNQVDALRNYISEKADVVIQNLRPGGAEKAGLDAKRLRALNDKLIYCNLGAFGRIGPLADRPGYDPLMQAFGGIMSVTGEEGRPPVRAGVSIVDMGTGMWAVIGIMAALQRRAQSGRGCEVDVSLFESALAWMTIHVANYSVSHELPERLGSGAFITVPYQAFKARDGFIVIAAGNASLFKKFCDALNHPEWAEDPRFRTNEDRLANKNALVALIEDEVGEREVSHWVSILEVAGVPCAPIQNAEQVIASPQTQALGILSSVCEDQMRVVGLPISFDGVRPGVRFAPAKLGEHTQLILGDTPPAKC